jgi:hypothetical protein
LNVTFHTLGAVATAAVLTLTPNEKWRSFSAVKKYAAGFVAGILVHGILDILPHNYPFDPKLDIVLALLLFFLVFVMAQKQNLILLVICFAGCLLPDVIDLGPAIANKYFRLPVLQLSFKIFPWHFAEYSGSIYDGSSRSIESTIYHSVFSLICAILIFIYRKNLFRINLS